MADTATTIDVYSNVVEDDEGQRSFRLVALVNVTEHKQSEREELEHRIKGKICYCESCNIA